MNGVKSKQVLSEFVYWLRQQRRCIENSLQIVIFLINYVIIGFRVSRQLTKYVWESCIVDCISGLGLRLWVAI